VAIVALMIPMHEPYADEAQAWQLARFSSIPALLSTLLHLEMTPGLWHALLRCEAALGVSYTGMHWVTAAIGAAGICLLLWRSPFPLWIRALLPFTYFLIYQYPIVARSYSLAPILLFALASQWNRRRSNPMGVALLLALLANLCAQTLMISIGFSIVLAVELWQRRAQTNIRRSHVLLAGVLLGAAICFGAWCCVPPSNAPWVIATHAWANAGQVDTNHSVLSPWHHRLALLQMAMKGRGRLLRGTMFSVAEHGLALPIWGTLLFLLFRSGRLRYLWPVALLAFFGTFTRFSIYHEGLMWLLLLNLVWISWPAKAGVVRRVLEVSLALCVAVQMLWSVRVMREEIYRPYDPSVDAVPVLADYLAQGRAVDLDMPPTPLMMATTPPAVYATGLQPYFATQPFENVSTRYWLWLGDPGAHERYLQATNDRRAVALIVGYHGREGADVKRLLSLGYRPSHRFCATVLSPHPDPTEEVCYIFYEPPLAEKP
jgi:hypothetical protein